MVGLLGVLAVTLGTFLVPRVARANSKNTFLETIGFSTAVGTVLGASTLPFYDQPGKHLTNLAYGAGIGAFVGLGIGLYDKITGGTNDRVFAEGEQQGIRPLLRPGNDGRRYDGRDLASSIQSSESRMETTATLVASYPTRPSVWLPVVSLTW